MATTAPYRLGRGRPLKYGPRPSRAVTLTLPKDVIARLTAIDADLGRAIVSVAESRAVGRPHAAPPAQISSYGRHAVIVVSAGETLKGFTGVQLVPIGGGRALISLDPPHSITRFEVDVRDALDGDDVEGPDRQALEVIADVLREGRHSRRVTLQARTIIVLESKHQRGAVSRLRKIQQPEGKS